MTPERWNEISTLARQKFKIVDEYTEELDPGSAEILECETPLGLLKLTFISKPRLLSKKTSYSNRIGSSTDVDYVFSPDEITYRLEITRYNPNSDSWSKLDSSELF